MAQMGLYPNFNHPLIFRFQNKLMICLTSQSFSTAVYKAITKTKAKKDGKKTKLLGV